MFFEQHDDEYHCICVWSIPLVFEAYVQSIAHLWIAPDSAFVHIRQSLHHSYHEQMLLLTGHVTPDRLAVSHYVLLCCNMPLGGHTTTIHVMTRMPPMSKSAIAQSKQVSRPLGTMLHVNLPTRPLSSLLIVPLATWCLVSQKQPLWGMNINDRLHSKLAPHPVLMFHICFSRSSWRKISMLTSALWGKTVVGLEWRGRNELVIIITGSKKNILRIKDSTVYTEINRVLFDS